MANKIFQILRNSTVYNDYTTAAAAFNVPVDVTCLIDGQMKSARYVDGNTEKAIIGIWNSTTKKWSMIDIESSLLHAVLNAKQINVTDPSSGETKALDEVIFENETVTAASLNDLNEKIKAIENANFGDSINNAISTAAEDAATKANAAKEAAIATAAEDATTKANAAQAAAISASDVTLEQENGTLIYTLYQGPDDNKSEIGKINISTAYQKPAEGIPATDLAEGVIPSFTIVNDHKGAGDDPDKIYVPSAESEKETYEGLIDDEEVLSKAINIINKKFINHINNSSLHKTFEDHELIESANENINALQKHLFNGHEYADLNLPSGTLWATKNIGAEVTFDVGSYFMWGDAKQRIDKSEFVVTDCLYTIDGTTFSDKYKSITSPNPNRPIGICLDVNDDPANATWHGMWRVPTFAQIEELFTEKYIHHSSDALGNWAKISNGKGTSIQLPISSYYVDNTEVQDMNTIYMMYRDIKGTDAMKIAKIELTGTDVNVTAVVSKESVPIWAGVIIRPVLN